MPAESTGWTADMVRALPDDGNRYELLDGELVVTPAPSSRHQDTVLELAVRLREYVKRHAVGHVYVSPAELQFSDRRLLQPDLFVAALVDGRRPRSWGDIRHVPLVVEVASPSTVKLDRGRKRTIYLEESVPDYWIVHLESRMVEWWRPGPTQPEIVDGMLSWQPAPAVPAFVMELEPLFDDLLS